MYSRRVSREVSLNELETAHISFAPKVLTFGLGPNDRSPVEHELHDILTLTNYGSQIPPPPHMPSMPCPRANSSMRGSGPTRKFTFFVPAENEKFSCRLHPGSGVIKTVRLLLLSFLLSLLLVESVDGDQLLWPLRRARARWCTCT